MHLQEKGGFNPLTLIVREGKGKYCPLDWQVRGICVTLSLTMPQLNLGQIPGP
jgi:hypothetical protein